MFRLLQQCFQIPSKVVYHQRLLQLGRHEICRFSCCLPNPQLLRQAPAGIIKAQDFHSSACRWKKKPPLDPEQDIVGLKYNITLKDIPKPARYLGYAGLIPFVSVPLIMGIQQVSYSELAFAQAAYGTCILSFLGGIRWGFALPEGSPDKPDWTKLTISVVPPLISWAALHCRSVTESAVTVIVGLGIVLHYDLVFFPTYPSWFQKLRTILTVVAIGSLIATIFLGTIFPEKHLAEIIREKIRKWP